MTVNVWQLVGAIALCSGCSTLQETMIPEIRYLESMRGYATQEQEGDRRLLSDPATGEKLRCADDVKHWLPDIQRGLTAEHDKGQVTRANLAVASPVLLVAAVAAVPSALLVCGSMCPALYLNWGDSVTFEQGRRLFDGGDAAGAVTALEAFAYENPSDARSGETYYWLGRAHLKLNDPEKAAAAFLTFVRHSKVAKPTLYDEAEKSGGVALPRCDQSPVSLFGTSQPAQPTKKKKPTSGLAEPEPVPLPATPITPATPQPTDL